MISVDGLAVEFGGTTLFSDISFVINEKDRIALMGKNPTQDSGRRTSAYPWQDICSQRVRHSLSAPTFDDRRRANGF